MKRWRAWTERDSELLRKFHAEGKTDEVIAYIMDRRRHVIARRRVRLGLKSNAKRGARVGWHHKPGACAKVAENNRRKWQDPDFRAKTLENFKLAREAFEATRFRRPLPGTPELSLFRRLCHAFGAETARAHLRDGTMAMAVELLEQERAARQFRAPPLRTPARNRYIKLRRVLGIAVARANLEEAQ